MIKHRSVLESEILSFFLPVNTFSKYEYAISYWMKVNNYKTLYKDIYTLQNLQKNIQLKISTNREILKWLSRAKFVLS